jgi:hypothetical protein
VEIRVNKRELQKAVTLTRSALSKVIIQQERGHILMSVSDGKMKVTGTNNDLKAMYILDVVGSGDERGAFTADPKVLSNVLKKIELVDVTLSIEPDSQELRVYTSEGSNSFAMLQSFPASSMLSFEPNSLRKSTVVSKESFEAALNYSTRYLSGPKEDSRNFDIVSISNGVMYAANGINMMGFMVSGAYKNLEDLRLRKAIIPIMVSVLGVLEDEDVGVIQTDSEVGVETPNVYFSALKPAAEPPTMPKNHLRSEGAYTLVDRKDFINHLDRLVISNTGNPGVIGVTMTVGGIGDSAYLDLSLVSSKSVERFSCQRVDDENTSPVSHMVEYRILKSVIGSFGHGDKIRLHINEEGGKMFKAYDKGTVKDDAYICVGIGGYVKMV